MFVLPCDYRDELEMVDSGDDQKVSLYENFEDILDEKLRSFYTPFQRLNWQDLKEKLGVLMILIIMTAVKPLSGTT